MYSSKLLRGMETVTHVHKWQYLLHEPEEGEMCPGQMLVEVSCIVERSLSYLGLDYFSRGCLPYILSDIFLSSPRC
jgi:hypothetical protein